MGLLAAEITARTGRDPSQGYGVLVQEFGRSWYERIDAPATSEVRNRLKAVVSTQLDITELGGESLQSIATTAPGNGAGIGGVKVTAACGWFAARPSGTEDVTKIYAESFRDEAHLKQIQSEAQAVVAGLSVPAATDDSMR